MQTIIGNALIGGLIVLCVMALILPILVGVQKRVHRFSFAYPSKFIMPFVGITIALTLFLALMTW